MSDFGSHRISRLHMVATLCTIAVLLGASCGGGKPDPPQAGPPSSPAPPAPGAEPGVVRIRGGERLAWDQNAASPDAVRTYTFRLFIDGAEAQLADTRCSTTATQAGYECSGRLPSMSAGRHILELVSIWNGQQSGRSSALTVMMGAPLETAQLPQLSDPSSPNDSAATIATGLDAIEWLSAVPDGRTLLFVEGRRAIRVVDDALLIAEPAYAVAESHEAIVGLAIDPRFASTRAVYLAWTEMQRDGSLGLNVSRFRLVGTTLGERATIVSGLPIAPGMAAPLTLDGNGLVYVAVPAAGRAGSIDPRAAGLIVRFTEDGAVPRENPTASPTLAIGLAQPTSLAIDHANGQLWAAGARTAQDPAIVTIPVDARAHDAWPWRSTATLASGATRPGSSIASLSISFTDPPALNVVSSGVARRATLGDQGAVGVFETVRFSAPGAVTGVADRADGRSFVAVATTAGGHAIFLVQN